MTRPMSEEELDYALSRARRVIAENEPQSVSYTEPRRHETLLIARALLSTSTALQEMREALEMAEGTLLVASRILTEDHKMVLGGKRWGHVTLAKINAAIEKATKP